MLALWSDSPLQTWRNASRLAPTTWAEARCMSLNTGSSSVPRPRERSTQPGVVPALVTASISPSSWTLAICSAVAIGAVVGNDDGEILLVQRADSGIWLYPTGWADVGYSPAEVAVKEVEEETGLRVTRWADGPVYEIEAVAEGLGWHLRVEAHLAIDYEGDLRLDDPDGIVVEARFVALDDCPGHLEAAQQWVWEPLGEWLRVRFAGPRRFGYQIVGTDAQALEITRV